MIEQLDATKTGGELMYSGRVNSSCSTSDTCSVTLVKDSMLTHEGGKKDGIVASTSGTYPWWTLMTETFRNSNPSYGGD